MMLENLDIENHLQIWMNTLQPDLAKTVRPLYLVNERGVLEQFASGTFIQVEKKFILLTALHVIDQLGKVNLYVAGKNEIIKIVGKLHHINSEREINSGRHRNDDFAIVVLEEEMLEQLSDVIFMPVERFNLGVIDKEQTMYFAFGYPSSKHKNKPPDVKNDIRKVYPFIYCSPKDEQFGYEESGVSEETHIAVSFDKENSKISKRLVMPPDPFGMSGGGLWMVQDVFSDNKNDVLLSGLLIEYIKSKKVILAVRMLPIIKFISSALTQ